MNLGHLSAVSGLSFSDSYREQGSAQPREPLARLDKHPQLSIQSIPAVRGIHTSPAGWGSRRHPISGRRLSLLIVREKVLLRMGMSQTGVTGRVSQICNVGYPLKTAIVVFRGQSLLNLCAWSAEDGVCKGRPMLAYEDVALGCQRDLLR